MGLAKRVIPCLDVTAGRVVKGVNFVGLRDAGEAVAQKFALIRIVDQLHARRLGSFANLLHASARLCIGVFLGVSAKFDQQVSIARRKQGEMPAYLTGRRLKSRISSLWKPTRATSAVPAR